MENWVYRYYIKHEAQTEPLLPDSMLDDVSRESQLHFLQLNRVEVATQLTLRDLQCFRDIQPAEYIIDLFKLHSDDDERCQTSHLDAFTEASFFSFIFDYFKTHKNSNSNTSYSKRFIVIFSFV